MLFNSAVFIAFAILFFLLLPLFKRTPGNIKWSFFVIASFFFYGWWNWYYLFIIIGSGLIDYWAALLIVKHPKYRKLLLVLSLSGNLGTLFLFKYSGYIAGKFLLLCSFFGFSDIVLPEMPGFFQVLPVGISFYTFQSMSYTIDVYRGKLDPIKNVLHFFSFLSLFPQLVAGPIVRAKDFLPQLTRIRQTTEAERWNGFRLIALGYFKKTVLADNLAPFVNAAFANQLTNTSTSYWWLVMTGFAFQIYFDFSGYSDIARGLAKWMGFHFRVNFNHPYLSASFREFWTRWHISLSTWFRDYVYIPLGGSKSGRFRSHVNLWITMLVSGFWHGAATHFIIWGGVHAAYLSFERITRWPERMARYPVTKVLSLIIVFILAIVAWTFFRADSSSQAVMIIGRMFSFNFSAGMTNPDFITTGFTCILLGLLMEISVGWLNPVVSGWFGAPVKKIIGIAEVTLLILGCFYLRGVGEQFIYFQF